MAAHRYWRLVGFAVAGAGPLELSEVQLYAGGARVGDTVVPTCPFAPASGALADLSDGLATGVVSWPASAHRAPGFALVWDLTGSGADVGALRLGSGNSAATFAIGFTLQYSDDGLVWATLIDNLAVAYPGGLGWVDTSEAFAGDADFYKVELLLHFDGVNGSTTFADSAPVPNTVSAYGTAQISTAQSMFGGASAFFNGSADRLSIPYRNGFALGGVFTIEAFIRPSSFAKPVAQIIGSHAYGANNDFVMYLDASGRVHFLAHASADVASYASVALNAWTHVAVCLDANTLRIFLNGVLDNTVGFSYKVQSLFASAITIGADATANANSFFSGYIDDLRVTKGVARYTGNFTLPTAPFPAAFPASLRSAGAIPSRMQGAALPNGAASSHLREYAFFDAYHGGLGIIYGTVKEKNTPANAPLRRKVWLMDERSGLVIRETWSDAATGAYEFRGIKQGTPYTVLAYDHAHNYRAFAGDNLLPDPLP